MVERLGIVQLDSVNVVVRSHFMPFYSRLGPYPLPPLSDIDYTCNGLFEYWGHEASLLPVHHYPMFRHRMEGIQPRYHAAEVIKEYPGYIDTVLEEVRQKGPLNASNLDDPGERMGSWWGHRRGKTALEWLYTKGLLAVRHRRNFNRVYDLTERVIPQSILSTPALSTEDAHREMLRLAAGALGVATAGDLADYYRISVPDARARLNELIEMGDLREVYVEGWPQPAFLHPDAKLPELVAARSLLTPFDSLIWERDRTERLFGFRYRIEIYVPPPKRKYGYYVMPFLLGGNLVARVDLKAQRDEKSLLVRGAFIEEGQDAKRVAEALADDLASMASWLALEKVKIGRRGNLTQDLRRLIK